MVASSLEFMRMVLPQGHTRTDFDIYYSGVQMEFRIGSVPSSFLHKRSPDFFHYILLAKSKQKQQQQQEQQRQSPTYNKYYTYLTYVWCRHVLFIAFDSKIIWGEMFPRYRCACFCFSDVPRFYCSGGVLGCCCQFYISVPLFKLTYAKCPPHPHTNGFTFGGIWWHPMFDFTHRNGRARIIVKKIEEPHSPWWLLLLIEASILLLRRLRWVISVENHKQ